MIGTESIGLESEILVWKFEPDVVRRFAEATGTPFDDRVPPTFVVTLRQANIPGVQLPIPGMIHGTQEITYRRQIQVGETLSCKRRIKDVYVRNGKLGKMTFIVIQTTGHDSEGELVFSSSSTLIAPTKGEDG